MIYADPGSRPVGFVPPLFSLAIVFVAWIDGGGGGKIRGWIRFSRGYVTNGGKNGQQQATGTEVVGGEFLIIQF